LGTNFKRHAVFRKADEALVCSYKTWQLQIYTPKNNYHFWAIYRKLNVLSFYSSYITALQRYITIICTLYMLHISTGYLQKPFSTRWHAAAAWEEQTQHYTSTNAYKDKVKLFLCFIS
jgi:hypothetical protein